MKKLMTLMLGLSIALGSVSLFAQNAPKNEKKTAKKHTKTKKAKKAKKTT